MYFRKKPFNQYISEIQNEDYKFIKNHARLKGELCGVNLEDITDLPYQKLKHTVPDLFQKSEFDKAIHLILKSYKKNITFGKVKKARNAKKFIFLLWVRSQYESLNKMENQYLFTPPDAKMLQAGVKDLDILGDVNTIDALAQGDILKWKKIRKMKYSEVFNKLLKNTIEGRINKKLAEINKQK